MLIFLLLANTSAISQQVTISGKDLSLGQVLISINQQTGIEFFYPSDLLKATRPVTLHVQQMRVEEVLKLCLAGQGLGFTLQGRTIVIFKDINAVQDPPTDNTVTIHGQVVDGRGVPVPMASVVLMRTRTGALTETSGWFTLKIKDPRVEDILTVSFVGLEEQQVQLAGKTNLGQIVLQLADRALDETIIVAYGTTSERFRTGDLTTVKAADIEKSPSLNVVEALAGRVPGLYVRQKTGNPASIFSLQLRGVNVIPPISTTVYSDIMEAMNKPLVVIDGMPAPHDPVYERVQQNGIIQQIGIDALSGPVGAGGGQDALYWINPLDIESVTVLKDAAATALYGSRAANGVLILTTRKGKPGKMALNLSLNTGINAQAKRLKLLNTEQYLNMRHEAWNNTMQAGLTVTNSRGIRDAAPNAINSYDLQVWDTTRYTDWQRVLLGSAPVYNAALSLSGGEGRTAYRIGASYNWYKSSYPHLPGKPRFREEKATVSFSLSTRSQNNRLKLNTAVFATATGSWQPNANPDNLILLAPNSPALFAEEGGLNFKDWRVSGPVPNGTIGHPLALLARLYRADRFTALATTTLSYEFLRSLVFTVGAAYARNEGRSSNLSPAAAIDPIAGRFTRAAFFGQGHNNGFNVEPNLRYETRWGRHYIAALAGVSYQSDRQAGTSISASGFLSDEQMGSAGAAASSSADMRMLQRKAVSALARFSYRYADQWLLDLAGRRDGSSSFGPGRRFGNFGSVGVGWIFTQSAWLKKIPLISFGKIRGSYGITGSQSATPYAYLSSFMPATPVNPIYPNANFNLYYGTDGTYQGVRVLSVSRFPNPSLGWAQAVSAELGIDLYLLDDQLKLTAQWYRKRTGDQLVVDSVSAVTGGSISFMNLPAKVENAGVEATIGYTSRAGRQAGMQWNVQLNIAANRNKLQDYPRLAYSPYNGYFTIGEPIFIQPLYASFLDKATGSYRLTDTLNRPAVPYYVNNLPTLTGGLQAGISWKRVSLSLSCTFARQKGFTNVQGTSYPGALNTFAVSNQPLSVIRDRHWQSPADTDLGGALQSAWGNYNAQLAVYWGDASYLACKNAVLSYELPPALLKKAGISQLSFYAKGENLLLIPLSGYQGSNPEQPGLTTQMPLRMIFVSGCTITL